MKHRVGLGGNYYFTSLNKKELEDVCQKIGKAKSSIYWNAKYKTYVIRIKSKYHKRKVGSSLVYGTSLEN